jgi:hypothetical protein
MQLPAAPRLALSIDQNLVVLEQVARLAPRVDKVGELQQLAKPDHFPPNGYLAPSRHLWESGDVMALP